jgi:hypothetical protein
LLPYLLVFLFLAIELTAKWWRRDEPIREVLHLDLVLAVMWIAYWLYIGGDYIGERFLLLLFPLGIFGLLKLMSSESNMKLVAFVVALVALSGILPLRLFDTRFRFVTHRYDHDYDIGKFLSEKYPGKSVMLGGLGKIPYLLDSYTIDMMGLVDPVIAHAPPTQAGFDVANVKFNIDYSLSKRPDLIVGELVGGSLDLDRGLYQTKYESAGYRVRYLVYTGLDEPAEPIIGVQGMQQDGVKELIRRGYGFAILVRQ